MSLRILPAFPDLLVDGERVLLFAGIASVDSAAIGFVHGLTSLLSRRRCGRAADKFAALESSSARTFSASAMSKYSFTRIGTITPSMNAFKSGSIPSRLCSPACSEKYYAQVLGDKRPGSARANVSWCGSKMAFQEPFDTLPTTWETRCGRPSRGVASDPNKHS